VDVGRILAERYVILRPLAEGAMSTVWVAMDQNEGVNVAIKTISLDASGWRAEIRDRFLKEARLLARGKHEHLVGVRDVGETDDGFLYLVLDLLDGETLSTRLDRETKLAWPEAVALVIGIARGVAALHRVAIVHRDLKPANVVLHRTESGVVPTIIDLGIGKASSVVGDPQLSATLTATGQVLGTPQYMSYEQALGQTDIDARTDVWALGVILYEILTGSRPFEAPNTNAVLAAIRRGNVRPIREVAPDVPVAITRIVERCLSADRNLRVADAAALSTLLEAAALSPSVAPDEPSTSVSRPRGHRFVAVIAALVVILSTLVFVLLRTRNTPSTAVREVVVDVKHSSVTSAPEVRPASNEPHMPSAAEATQVPVRTSIVPSSRPSSSSVRNRPPLSRIDEAGF
jgi:eukaryotic-like serine/threonine-protein kinase